MVTFAGGFLFSIVRVVNVPGAFDKTIKLDRSPFTRGIAVSPWHSVTICWVTLAIFGVQGLHSPVLTAGHAQGRVSGTCSLWQPAAAPARRAESLSVMSVGSIKLSSALWTIFAADHVS